MNRAFETYIASLVSSLVLMVALTLLDVWVVYFLLYKNGLLLSLPLFWWFPLWVMEFTFPLSLILVFENRVPLTCYLFFLLGGEDTLYYLFATGRVPEVYGGIYFLGFIFAPRKELVLATLLPSTFLSTLICYMDYRKVKSSRADPRRGRFSPSD